MNFEVFLLRYILAHGDAYHDAVSYRRRTDFIGHRWSASVLWQWYNSPLSVWATWSAS
jgi:hypothetical protein